eukprot:12156612-Prorocentrum_lima.AAC.1
MCGVVLSPSPGLASCRVCFGDGGRGGGGRRLRSCLMEQSAGCFVPQCSSWEWFLGGGLSNRMRGSWEAGARDRSGRGVREVDERAGSPP